MKKLRFYSIGNKMIVYFSVLFAIVIILIGTITYRMFSKALEQQMVQETQKIMAQAMINADFYLSDIKTPMIMMARNPNVIHILRDYTTSEWVDRLGMQRILEDFTRNINQFKSYIKDIILVSRDGFVYNIASADEISKANPLLQSDWLKAIIAKDQKGIQFVTTHASSYYVGAFSKDKVISAVLPIEENTKVLGYVLCDINLQKFREIFESLSLGAGGYIYMVDEQGTIIVHPDSAMIGSVISFELLGRLSADGSAGTGSFKMKLDGEEQLIIYNQSKITGWMLVGDIPYANLTKAAGQNRAITYLILALGFVFIVLISFLISRQITKPLKTLIDRMKKVQTHDLSSRQVDYGQGEIAVIGQRFEGMVYEINKLISEVYVSNLKQKEAELKELQNQINPHFLYNTLQLVKAEAVFENHREVSTLVTTLGDLLRYPMYGRSEPVALREELAYIGKYTDIYQRRFRGKFEYVCEVQEDELLAMQVPKLILQPVVENGIVHGFSDTRSGGLLRIVISRNGMAVDISVWDNGKGIGEEQLKRLRERLAGGLEEDGGSIGLLNVLQRIHLKYGNDYGISVSSEQGVFTEVKLTLPIAAGERT
ncbi:cache domain-containing sensor histidine kinase [Paenibacillus thalictri]|uniref:cache domain-containing sensor histidine kinase n=1 Tax=Paenibacillus thalictri TaxID=2527873 RepID=UPI0013EF1A00|nr:sensor histidine kinase [Paenibacillus thalictri]